MTIDRNTVGSAAAFEPGSTRSPAVLEVDLAADLGERRRRAIDEAVTEATSGQVSDPDSWAPSIALRRYGPGCLALALAGTVDPAGTERVRELGPTLARLAPVELVIDLSRLGACAPPLTRALARLRRQRLIAGARVELHHPPAALAAELGGSPAETYTVHDVPGPAGAPQRSRINSDRGAREPGER